jgi:hypothetical protein
MYEANVVMNIPDNVMYVITNMFSGDMNKKLLAILINNLTVSQIIKYQEYMNVVDFARNTGITTDDIVKKMGSRSQLLRVTNRFYTEEDLIKYPSNFNPRVVLSYSNVYCSKATFKILNKEHGRRMRWDDKLINMRSILVRLRLENINHDVIKYLNTKIDESNGMVLKAAEILSVNTPSTKYQSNVVSLGKFIRKFKE